MQELTDEYEYKLQEEQLALQRIKEEKEDLLKELEETRRQVTIATPSLFTHRCI